MVATATAYDACPISFRYPHGEGAGVQIPEVGQGSPIGRGRVQRERTDVALLSFGAHLLECLLAAEVLAGQGVSATVADARFTKPLDTALIDQLARHHAAIFTGE